MDEGVEKTKALAARVLGLALGALALGLPWRGFRSCAMSAPWTLWVFALLCAWVAALSARRALSGQAAPGWLWAAAGWGMFAGLCVGAPAALAPYCSG